MILTREEALHCSKVFHDYFSNMGSTEEYMRDEKLKNVAEMPSTLFPIVLGSTEIVMVFV